MKKKKVLISIVICVIAFIVVFGALEGKQIVFNNIYYSATITHKDIKSINLSSVNDITIVDNKQTIKLNKSDVKYQTVCKAFNGKRVKTDSDIHFWNEDDYRIEISTDKQKYVLYGSPSISVSRDDRGINYDKYIDFVLYDYSNGSTNESLYQLVRIRTEDFLKIFPDFPERIEEN